jgi:hypothetical protein
MALKAGRSSTKGNGVTLSRRLAGFLLGAMVGAAIGVFPLLEFHIGGSEWRAHHPSASQATGTPAGPQYPNRLR